MIKMANIEQKFIKNYSTAKIKPTAVAWHYTGNPGSSAQGNWAYFNNQNGSVYSHFIVGLNGEILQLAPLDIKSNATNEANSYTVSVECCHPDSSGKFTDATYKSMVELGAYLHKELGIDKDIRHYDVTKKICPKWFVDHPADWAKFKRDIIDKIKEEEIDMETITQCSTEELRKLNEKISDLQNQVNGLMNMITNLDKAIEPVKIKYGYVDGNMPEWARDTIQKIKNQGYLRGDENGNLQLNDELLRMFVVLDRAGNF